MTVSGLFPDAVRRLLGDARGRLLAGALGLTLLTLAAPRLPVTGQRVEAVVVVDITGSMNTRDEHLDGKPVSRLDKTKAALRALAADLPCGSRLGLGLFAERRTFLLFEPIDTCADFAALDGAIAGLDWRMGWEGDSRIAAGLFRAIALAGELGSDLVFVTDGHEAPPLPARGGPAFEGKPGAVRGLIVGAGGHALAPIPRYDDRGREIGFYGPEDVPHENRFGPPPPGAETREGYNPRNAPFGGVAPRGTEHLSSVRETYLRGLAAETGLAYVPLDDPAGLAAALTAVATTRPRPVLLDLRPWLGAAALALLLVLFGLLPWRARLGGAVSRLRHGA
ncbi:von Willebrand factor A [Methylobacterium indicum]|uniref:von Willebrand factor A n=3 Tax=Methylobacterium indicum TaxID=1775910 RepID=A0ABR5HGV6_9HYPH|nr:VWA domain-containing protein [Methylobacterium indicum]KMO25871.1 von Willebrand factor A [Methylobacterium indicum]KTS34717.1 von Willebrand factor A [Methylobacterium indicum]